MVQQYNDTQTDEVKATKLCTNQKFKKSSILYYRLQNTQFILQTTVVHYHHVPTKYHTLPCIDAIVCNSNVSTNIKKQAC